MQRFLIYVHIFKPYKNLNIENAFEIGAKILLLNVKFAKENFRVMDIKSLLLTVLREREDEIINSLFSLNESEWDALIATAMQHKLGPILYNTLKPYYSALSTPPQYQVLMRQIYFSSARRNMQLYNQLEEVLQKFAKEGISVILLKGAYLAKYIYGNIALRPMADIDLLVKQGSLNKAHCLLIDDGYSITDSNFEEELPPYKKKGKIALEIHSHLKILPDKKNTDINKLWTKAEKVTIGKADALTLCPEDHFLHLCLHNCIQHRFENGLIACTDTQFYLKHFKEKLNWEQLWQLAQEWKIERAVYLMLALTEKLIKVPMPEQIRQGVEPDQDSINALSEAEELIFLQQRDVGKNLALIFGQMSLREKVKIIWNRIFLPKEIIKIDKKHRFFWSRLQSLYNSHRRTAWLALRGDLQTIKAIETQNRRSSLKDWLTYGEEP